MQQLNWRTVDFLADLLSSAEQRMAWVLVKGLDPTHPLDL